ncbi:MAG: hypothetical protein F4Z74_07740 [Acidobacteria bacterium]|nr:hypothetical protein [Acidobacteriota bacterium]MYE44320.1 hypothetical protein [Acidobacteriota bacterium]
MAIVGAMGDWLLTPSGVAPDTAAETSVERNARPGTPAVRAVQTPRGHEGAAGKAPEQEGEARTSSPPEVVPWATWQDPIAPTIDATRTLLGRGNVVLLRTQYSDGTSSTEELIERPSGTPNERRFDVEPGNEQSEYITVSDSGVVRWFAWDGTSFLTHRASWIHTDFLALSAKPAEPDCIPKQLSPTVKEIVSLYEQLQDFKNAPGFAEFGFSVAGPYHQWMEDVTRVVAGSSPDEGALQLDQLGFTGGDVMNLGLDFLNPEGEEEKRSILDTERRIRAGLALATCDSSVSSHH